MGYMIGVDVGGTFTDFSVYRHENGKLFHYKHSSTNQDSSIAIVNGILKVLELEKEKVKRTNKVMKVKVLELQVVVLKK